jgi:5'(3')-deoxyribonucleotidase
VAVDEYAELNCFDISKVYNIDISEFWRIISEDERFWIDLKPFDWAYDLLKFLKDLGYDITIVSSPSQDYKCVSQKLEWLDKHFNIKSNDVFLGSKKYLMAGNGILIDDYYKNTDKFIANGGKAILIPSNWNDKDISFDKIKNIILNNL